MKKLGRFLHSYFIGSHFAKYRIIITVLSIVCIVFFAMLIYSNLEIGYLNAINRINDDIIKNKELMIEDQGKMISYNEETIAAYQKFVKETEKIFGK